jgi:Ferritin-like domain
MSDVPANDTRENTPGPLPSRRSFLTRAAGASAVALPALTLLNSSKAKAGQPKSSKGKAAPPNPSKGKAAHPTKLTGLTATLLQEIMNDEASHVTIIQHLLNDPDNPLPVPIRMPPTFNLAALTQPTLQDFFETASAFENTGSGLYHGALLNITQTEEYFPTAAGLAAVESRHAAWLNSLLGESLVPDFAPVEAPIDQSVTLSRVTSFVNDPRSTFPAFDTTVVSDANNFFILDFILFLEYIEAKFYAINVPRFAVIT